MAQRILQPGQIESLAQRSIPRVRLPDPIQVFKLRAARLRALAQGSALGGYLEFLATLSDAQQKAVTQFRPAEPTRIQIEQANEHRMPPLLATSWQRDPAWLALLRDLADDVAQSEALADGAARICRRVVESPDDFIESQADAVLGAGGAEVDLATAPFVMAALQVYWVALGRTLKADEVATLDVPGVCPLCGTLPVASVLRAQAPYAGYRYLHCALCATEWHMVRVQCSTCGADGKHIAYHSLQAADAADQTAAQDAAVRAEACSSCHSYRKIVYQEKDFAVDPVADDVATLALDVLLSTQGFARASGNPLFWQGAQE